MTSQGLLEKINVEAARDGRYLPTLDGWRAIAITMVLLAHGSDSIANTISHLGLSFDLHILRQIGLYGVQIFFGLSGFLITSRLLADEGKRGRISLSSFYIRRAFRILPASLTFLVVAGVLALLGVLPITAGRWLSTLLFFVNYSTAEKSWFLGHFWSLAVEEHFYFIWPFAFLLLATKNRRIGATVGVAILLALWRAVDFKFQITGSSPDLFWGRTDIQVDGIIWGVVVALLHADAEWKVRLETILRYPLFIPVLVVVYIASIAVTIHDWKIAFTLLTLRAILIPMLILGTLINANHLLHALLETPVLRWMGRISYSIYLWQQMFFVWDEFLLPRVAPLQSFPLNLFAVLACALLSRHFIEKPGIAIGHRLSARRTAPRVTRADALPP